MRMVRSGGDLATLGDAAAGASPGRSVSSLMKAAEAAVVAAAGVASLGDLSSLSDAQLVIALWRVVPPVARKTRAQLPLFLNPCNPAACTAACVGTGLWCPLGPARI